MLLWLLPPLKLGGFYGLSPTPYSPTAIVGCTNYRHSHGFTAAEMGAANALPSSCQSAASPRKASSPGYVNPIGPRGCSTNTRLFPSFEKKLQGRQGKGSRGSGCLQTREHGHATVSIAETQTHVNQDGKRASHVRRSNALISESHPLVADRIAIPTLYGRAHELLSQRGALCLIELAKRAHAPSPGFYGPLTVVVEPRIFADELRLPLWAVWPALEELAARELLIRRDGSDCYYFDPNLAASRLRMLGGDGS